MHNAWKATSKTYIFLIKLHQQIQQAQRQAAISKTMQIIPKVCLWIVSKFNKLEMYNFLCFSSVKMSSTLFWWFYHTECPTKLCKFQTLATSDLFDVSTWFFLCVKGVCVTFYKKPINLRSIHWFFHSTFNPKPRRSLHRRLSARFLIPLAWNSFRRYHPAHIFCRKSYFLVK